MLRFANPAALWLLTLIVPLILLYLLKQKRRDYIVPSIFLWKQALEDVRAQSPFQKLRSSLLLLLQILILVLTTAILSEPYALESPIQSRRWILILDTSAGMQSTDVSPNRFIEARNRLIKILDGIPKVDEVMIMKYSTDASVLHGFSRNHAVLKSQLSDVSWEDVPTDWEKFPRILEPLLKQKPRPNIVLASDFAGFPASIQQQIPLEAVTVGKTGLNLALTQVTLQPAQENMEDQILFLQISNHSTGVQNTGVEIRKDDALIDAFDVRIGPSERKEFTKTLKIPAISVIAIRLTAADVLQLDNDFVLYAHPRPKIGIRLAFNNPYVVRALRALPAVEVSDSAPIQIDRQGRDPELPGIFFLNGEFDDTAEIIQWNRMHPALRFVDPGLWRFRKYRILSLPPDGEQLLETTKGVVAYAAGTSKNRRVVVGFPLEESNLGLFAGFPVFLSNTLEWIQEGLKPGIPYLTGSAHPKEGPYKENNVTGYANFADRKESNVTPEAISGTSHSEQQTALLRKEFSSWLLFALIGFVMLEWYAFHKKYEV